MERFIAVSGTYIHKIKKNKELKQEEENNHTNYNYNACLI